MSVSHYSGNDAPVELLVEVRSASTSGDLAPRVAVPEDFRKRSAELAATVVEVAEAFRSKLAQSMRELTNESTIQSVEIEFGINLKAEAGVVIGKASAGATFTARLTLASGRPT